MLTEELKPTPISGCSSVLSTTSLSDHGRHHRSLCFESFCGSLRPHHSTLAEHYDWYRRYVSKRFVLSLSDQVPLGRRWRSGWAWQCLVVMSLRASLSMVVPAARIFSPLHNSPIVLNSFETARARRTSGLFFVILRCFVADAETSLDQWLLDKGQTSNGYCQHHFSISCAVWARRRVRIHQRDVEQGGGRHE